MALNPGTRLGPYEILAPLGAGGMGEVYRARDTRLGRDVAVKVLPQHLSSNPEVRARFEREARSISSLNHPHICALYDVGREDDTDFLVMELLEGETLAARLSRGALPTADVVRLGMQIAGALDRAHRAGVVHRDLKPANVMLTRSGAKLMDFGLAKAVGSGAVPAALTGSPTATTPLTADGAIVGTFQYMAPEQLEGKEADARTDLFALGVVLYEMATGRRAFEGKTQASLMAAILRDEPREIGASAVSSPPALDRLVRQCMRKDPEERIQSAHDVALQLEGIAEAGSAPAHPGIAAAPARSRSRERIAWGIAVLATLAAIAVAAWALRAPAATPPVIVSAVLPPEGDTFTADRPGVALSPDGSRIAFAARGPAGSGIWVRPLASGRPTLLVAAEDAECPIWSPDGRKVGYHAAGQLNTIDLSGGQSRALAPMAECLGASWGSDGSIVYVAGRSSPIMRIPESGGQPVAIDVSQADTRRIYSHPSLLPDGRHILYTANDLEREGENSGVFVATTEGKDERRLLPILTNARFVSPGYLVYAKDGALRAQAFDPESLALGGEPIALLEGVQYVGYYQQHLFSISDQGLLAYVEGRGMLTRQLTWVDRQGAILGTAGTPGNYFSPRISHDGRRIAYDQSEATSDSGDIWVLDLDRGIPTRLTFDPRNESSPNWSPDDSRLAFFGNVGARSDLFTVASDGTGTPETLLSDEGLKLPSDWSNDGESILMQQRTPSQPNPDLMVYSFSTGKKEPWLATPFVEKEGRFSPDRRWVAYISDESGRTEVYVRGFSPPGGKWRVSSDGGSDPVWRRDGKELFYLSPGSEMMSVTVGDGTRSFEGGAPVPLFKIPGSILGTGDIAQYDISPDGRRFLVNLNTPTQGQRTITLVSNWTSLLGKR